MNEAIYSLDLSGLDGDNPLAFLAAVGALAVLSETDSHVQLGWKAGARWTPFLASPQPLEQSGVLQRLAARLRGKPVDAEKKNLHEEAQKRFNAAKLNCKKAMDRFKKRGLRGKERDAAREQEVTPYQQALDAAHDQVLEALREAVPSPELSLGQGPDCTIEEFRRHARSLRDEAKLNNLTTVNLLASFGAEVSDESTKRIAPTPFCFITGSGHQWFLDTARELMELANESRLRKALFERWAYTDEKFTMRWDPLDDRRYALMDRDPTASDNKSTTVWMANLLAYFGLSCFPCAPTLRGLATASWVFDDEPPCFRWPVWTMPLRVNSVRSILTHPTFGMSDQRSDWKEVRAELRARGIDAIFAARRVQVGNPPLQKINFSQAYGA
jgi:hypothetical protein